MTSRLMLPTADGKLARLTLTRPPRDFPDRAVATVQPHRLFGAAHVVCRSERGSRSVAQRGDRLGRDHRVPQAYLWSLGLGVAEAMDTAQRGMGLDWKTSLELIRRSPRCGEATSVRPAQ